jgi:hypothetical protein
MPTTFPLYQRDTEASTTSQANAAPPRLTPAEIAFASVFSALIVCVMIFCLYRFFPGRSWRQKRKVDSEQPSTHVKQTFLDLDDGKTLTENHPPGKEVKQTFLNLDEEKSMSEKKGLGIDMHPALRSSNERSKRKHGSNNDSLDSTSSTTPLIRRSDILPPTPPLSYSPRIYSPHTPPPVPGTSTKVRISPKRTRPLPTPVQPAKSSPEHPPQYDISPLQSSATFPDRSQLPMSFLFEIDAKREDQTGVRPRTVSPLQNPPTPVYERLISESQLNSRDVSPISAPSTTPVITYPSATPVYLPRPFSKYNPYRPALEPATSKNWPLENMPIPEHSAVIGHPTISPVRKHLTQSPLKSQRTTSPTPTTTSSQPAVGPEKEAMFTHPELDPMFLEEFHRRRHQQQKAKEEAHKQKRKADRDKPRKNQQLAALRPAKKLPTSSKEKGIPPNRPSTANPKDSGAGVMRSKSIAKARVDASDKRPYLERKKSLDRKSAQRSGTKQQQHPRLPPRLPSKSRKPSQSPDAYERARRISGLHELVGSSSVAVCG